MMSATLLIIKYIWGDGNDRYNPRGYLKRWRRSRPGMVLAKYAMTPMHMYAMTPRSDTPFVNIAARASGSSDGCVRLRP